MTDRTLGHFAAENSIEAAGVAAGEAMALDERTATLLSASIVPMLLRLAWPNVLVMLAQSAIGLIELWYVARLGTSALEAMALVTPLLMLMQMMSQGAMGGGIAAAIARALGRGDRRRADALLVHAIVLNATLGVICSALVLLFGDPLFRLFGGAGETLRLALIYVGILFVGMPILWIFNALNSALRGTGNMVTSGFVICGGAVALVPLSPLFIFGFGPVPALGIAGAGLAVLTYYAGGTAILTVYFLRGRSILRFRPVRLAWDYARDILAVGAMGIANTLQTNLNISILTGFVSKLGTTIAVAGFGVGSRIEYLMTPLAFGLGAPLVALVGMHIGAGLHTRALRLALIGGLMSFAITETVGILAASFPVAWIGLFNTDPRVVAAGSLYLRICGPFFGFYGMGITLYFASQGAGRLGWPLAANLTRLTITAVGAWVVLATGGSLTMLFALNAFALSAYGGLMLAAVSRGSWDPPGTSAVRPSKSGRRAAL